MYGRDYKQKAKLLYEKGENIHSISKTLAVAYNTLLDWKQEDEWVYDSKTAEIDKELKEIDNKTHSTAMALAEAKGLTKGVVYSKIVGLMEHQKPVILKKGKEDEAEFYTEWVDDGNIQVRAVSEAVGVLGMKLERHEVNVHMPTPIAIHGDNNKTLINLVPNIEKLEKNGKE